MRILTIIVLIQSAMVAWLLVRLDAVDGKLSRLSAATAPPAHSAAPDQPAKTSNRASADGQPGAPSLSPERLRAIIRQELGDMLSELSSTQSAVPASPEANPSTSGRLAAAGDTQRMETVAHDIDYYISVGYISDGEMSRLQSDIARLPDPERRRMLAKLVGALNSGQLEGRF